MRATQEKIRAEIKNVARAAESEYRTALAKEARLAASLEGGEAGGAGHEPQGDRVQRAASARWTSNQQLYQDLLTKTKQTGLETELKTTNIRVVERAERAARPGQSRTARATTSWRCCSVSLLGVGLALGFEHLDNTFKTPDDIKEHLGVPFLGMVPEVEVKGAALPARRAAGAAAWRSRTRTRRGRRLPRAAHEPDLHLGADDGRAGARRDEREPGRGQDDDGREPRRGARAQRREGAGGRRGPAAARRCTSTSALQKTPGADGPDRRQGDGLAGHPDDAHQRPAAAALRLPAAEPGGAAGLADDEAGRSRRCARTTTGC